MRLTTCNWPNNCERWCMSWAGPSSGTMICTWAIFSWRMGEVYLLDGYAVRKEGLKQEDVLHLADGVQRYATIGDLRRGWDLLGPAGPMPSYNPVRQRRWRKFVGRSTGENRYFGAAAGGRMDRPLFQAVQGSVPLVDGQPSPGHRERLARGLAAAAGATGFGSVHGPEAQPAAGMCWTEKWCLGGRPIPIIIKRPRRKYWYRYLNEIGRGGRARRAWRKSWNLIVRDLPTAWPLLLMEKASDGIYHGCHHRV